MAEREHIADSLRHMEWADARMWGSVLRTPAAGADDRLKTLLHHVHLVQYIYLALWREVMPQLTGAKSFADLDAVQEWARPFYKQAAAVIAGLDDRALERRVTFPWADQIEKQLGACQPVSVRDSLTQIFIHTAYHRGQVATRVRELGGEPSLTDFIAWAWTGRPAPDWERGRD